MAVLCEQGDLISVPPTPHTGLIWVKSQLPVFVCLQADGWVADFTAAKLPNFSTFDQYVCRTVMIKAIVTDIRRHDIIISFVKEILFPYARANLAALSADTKTSRRLNTAARVLQRSCAELDTEQLNRTANTVDDEDKKVTPFKVFARL